MEGVMAETRDEWVFKARIRVLSTKGQITKMEAIRAVREMDRLYKVHKTVKNHYVEVHELDGV